MRILITLLNILNFIVPFLTTLYIVSVLIKMIQQSHDSFGSNKVFVRAYMVVGAIYNSNI